MGNDETELTKKLSKYTIWAGIIGISLLILGVIGEDVIPNILSKIFIELGLGFLVASIVSKLFDEVYHRVAFLEPINEIDNKIKEVSLSVSELNKLSSDKIEESTKNLVQTVSNFNQVVKFTQEQRIIEIRKRKTGNTNIDWMNSIKSCIQESQKFLFVIARSLDTLIPTKSNEDGLLEEIQEIILNKNIITIFILANTFDNKSGFFDECLVRDPVKPSAIYDYSRHTVVKLVLQDNRVEHSGLTNMCLIVSIQYKGWLRIRSM